MSERKLTRHEMREAALLILFQSGLNDSPSEELIDEDVEAFGLEYNNESVKLVNGVIEHADELNGIISEYSTSRSLDRISVMNRTIMKIALYEILYCPSVPDKVAINEAVELSKEYCEKNDTAFINGLLSAFYRKRQSELATEKKDG